MSDWTLTKVFQKLHEGVEQRLTSAREAFTHSGTKGDASESVWNTLFNDYLPSRYCSAKAIAVDAQGHFSDQLDVVVYDRQYSPIIFSMEGQTLIPAESIYAIFEAKQTLNAEHVEYAQSKVASVRELVRTSLPITHLGGKGAAQEPQPILGGILTLDSTWKPPLGEPLQKALKSNSAEGLLDMGCVASHGTFWIKDEGLEMRESDKATTTFLLELIARLQDVGTVRMLDLRAYATWLDKK